MVNKQLKMFLRLKVKEVGNVVLFVFDYAIAVTIGFLLLGGAIFLIKLIPERIRSFFFLIFAGTILIVAVIGLIWMFSDWIKSNWKKAGKLVQKSSQTSLHK